MYALEEQAEHLRNNHLGPHEFWFDAKKFIVKVPSMTCGELITLAGVSPTNFVFREMPGDKPDIPISHSEVVNLTDEPHFYSVPPATMWG